MDPQEFNSILAQYSPSQSSDTTVAPVSMASPSNNSAPQHSGGFLSHLLPIAGSILGAALAPETGGLSLMAAAGLGSAGGQAAENFTEGKKILSGNDLTAAIEGGAGAGVGELAGKALTKGADMAANRATKLTDAATQTDDNAAALKEAQTIRNNYGGIKPGVQSSNDLEGNMKLLKQFGVDHTDPQAMANASKGGLFINDIDQSALQAGAPIKTTDLISGHDVTAATPEEQQALASPKVGIIDETGKMSDTVTPQQANAFAQELNSQIRDLQGLSANAKAAGNINDYNMAKQQLSDLTKKYNTVQSLASTPEVNAAVAARTITPEEKQSLIEQYGQAQADHIENAVNSAQTHQDLVTAKLPFAQMNELSSLALNNAKASGTPAALARAKADIAPEDTTSPPNPAETGANIVQTVANPHGNLVNKALGSLTHAANNPKLMDVMSRIGALGDKIAPETGAALGAANATLQNNGSNDIVGADMQPTANLTTQPQNSAAGGLSRDDLITLALYAPSAFNSVMQASVPQQQNVVAANNAEQALGGLGNAPNMGILSSLGGHLGIGGAGAYQRRAQQAAQEVAAALPGTDAGSVERELTNYMAGGGNIQDAVRSLMTNLQAVKQNNTNSPYQLLMNFHPSNGAAAATL